jgi:hypothetical protein
VENIPDRSGALWEWSYGVFWIKLQVILGAFEIKAQSKASPQAFSTFKLCITYWVAIFIHFLPAATWNCVINSFRNIQLFSFSSSRTHSVDDAWWRPRKSRRHGGQANGCRSRFPQIWTTLESNKSPPKRNDFPPKQQHIIPKIPIKLYMVEWLNQSSFRFIN